MTGGESPPLSSLYNETAFQGEESALKKRLGIGFAIAFLAIAVPFTHVDHFAGTFGVSIGTNTHYCSVENVGVSCEAVQ
jgi:hypothetical protein